MPSSMAGGASAGLCGERELQKAGGAMGVVPRSASPCARGVSMESAVSGRVCLWPWSPVSSAGTQETVEGQIVVTVVSRVKSRTRQDS